MLHLIPIDPPLAAVVPTRFVPFVENLAYDSVSPTQITFFVVHTAYLTFSGWLLQKGAPERVSRLHHLCGAPDVRHPSGWQGICSLLISLWRVPLLSFGYSVENAKKQHTDIRNGGIASSAISRRDGDASLGVNTYVSEKAASACSRKAATKNATRLRNFFFSIRFISFYLFVC